MRQLRPGVSVLGIHTLWLQIQFPTFSDPVPSVQELKCTDSPILGVRGGDWP